MNCVMSGTSLKYMRKSIQALAKIGDEMYIHASEDQFVFRTVNQSTTFFGIIEILPPVFEQYTFTKSETSKEINCKLPMKAMLTVYKPHVEKYIDYCSIELEHNPTKIVFKTQYYGFIDKVQTLWLVDGETVTVTVSRDPSANVLITRGTLYMDALVSFLHAREITLIVHESKVILRNYVEGEIRDRRRARSQLFLSTTEFSSYKLHQETAVTFALKPFRAAIHFAEAFHQPITMSFVGSGQPIELFVSDSHFEAQFIIATMNIEHMHLSCEKVIETQSSIQITETQSSSDNNPRKKKGWDQLFTDSESDTDHAPTLESLEGLVNKKIASNLSKIDLSKAKKNIDSLKKGESSKGFDNAELLNLPDSAEATDTWRISGSKFTSNPEPKDNAGPSKKMDCDSIKSERILKTDFTYPSENKKCAKSNRMSKALFTFPSEIEKSSEFMDVKDSLEVPDNAKTDLCKFRSEAKKKDDASRKMDTDKMYDSIENIIVPDSAECIEVPETEEPEVLDSVEYIEVPETEDYEVPVSAKCKRKYTYSEAREKLIKMLQTPGSPNLTDECKMNIRKFNMEREKRDALKMDSGKGKRIPKKRITLLSTKEEIAKFIEVFDKEQIRKAMSLSTCSSEAKEQEEVLMSCFAEEKVPKFVQMPDYTKVTELLRMSLNKCNSEAKKKKEKCDTSRQMNCEKMFSSASEETNEMPPSSPNMEDRDKRIRHIFKRCFTPTNSPPKTPPEILAYDTDYDSSESND